MIVLTPPAGGRLVEAEALEIHTGGAESNVAVYLAQLGHRVAWVSRVGTDPFGERLLAAVGSAGVDVSGVRRKERRPTGVYFKDHDGRSTVAYYYRRGSAASTMTAGDVLPLLARTRYVHISGITAALGASCRDAVERIITRAGEVGATVSFDVNYRPALWDPVEAGPVLRDLARRADVVFVGRDEAAELWGAENAREVRALVPEAPRVVVKDGAAGATAYAPDGSTFVPAPKVQVVETVGAGDAFAAGYLSAALRGADETARLRWGHLLASVALRSVADHVVVPPWTALAEAADAPPSEGWPG
ncbi:MAG: sugar kinase [Streptosporangiales bacterium]|nr:sugar kinase [Streptosporangiales bacterium]